MEELCHPRRQGDITIARKREKSANRRFMCRLHVVVRRKHGGRHNIMFWHLLLFILLLSSLSAYRNQLRTTRLRVELFLQECCRQIYPKRQIKFFSKRGVAIKEIVGDSRFSIGLCA